MGVWGAVNKYQCQSPSHTRRRSERQQQGGGANMSFERDFCAKLFRCYCDEDPMSAQWGAVWRRDTAHSYSVKRSPLSG